MSALRVLVAEKRDTRRISGGYRYNAAMAKEMAKYGVGSLARLSAPDELESLHADTILVDSLWLSEAPSAFLSKALTSRAAAIVILGHYFPPDNPCLSADEKALWLDSARRWVALADSIIVTGFGAVRSWSAAFPDVSVSVAPPAVPLVRREATPSVGPLRLVTVGAVTPAKLPIDVLEAISQRRAGEFEWHIVGSLECDPSHSAQCMRLVAESESPTRIRFLGPLAHEDTLGAVAGADIYLATSLFESFGMASAEALALGVPLLGFDVGDVASWAGNDPGCCLFKPGDVTGFSSALDAWLLGGRAALPQPRKPLLPQLHWSEATAVLLASASSYQGPSRT